MFSNEFLKVFYIRLAIFLSILFKYLFNIFLLKIVKEYFHNDALKSRKGFEKKRKQVRETIKSKMTSLKSIVTCSFFFFFPNPIKYPFCIFFFFFFFG
jgi:hypothetical protein